MPEELLEYMSLHSSAEPEHLAYIARDTNLNVLNPHMLSGHIQGRLLSMLAQMIRPKRILELGTFTAYSTLCLAESPATEIVTIERNDELEDRIRHNLSLSPLGSKVHLIIGDACEELTRLKGSFDLVFIDADKRQYPDYLDLVLPLVPQNGWIIADNTLWDGHITDHAYDHDKQTLGLRRFNDIVAQHPCLHSVILPVRDGLTLIHKRAITLCYGSEKSQKP